MKSVVLPEYPLYEIYEDGRVLNVKSGKWITSILQERYYRINLWNSSGVRKSLLTHRLIALAFIPNPLNKPFVDHIDRDKLNNSLDNLRWVNESENSQNRSKLKKGSSQYQGVSFSIAGRKQWKASISAGGHNIFLGSFSTELEAHHAYQEAKSRFHIKS